MPLSLHDKYALAHAVFACLAVLFTMPLAILSGRFLRSRLGSRWLHVHIAFNLATCILFIIIFGLGMKAVKTANEGAQFNGPQSDIHHKLGLMLFILLLVQGMLGFSAHRLAIDTIMQKPIRVVHSTFGIIVAGLAYAVVWNGMHTEWPSMSTNLAQTPVFVQILFWIFFLVEVGAWMLSAGESVLNAMWRHLLNNGGYEAMRKEKMEETCAC